MTKAPRASVIQLQSEFKALLLNLEHNTEALEVSLRPERSTVAKTLPEKHLKNTGTCDDMMSPPSDTEDCTQKQKQAVKAALGNL